MIIAGSAQVVEFSQSGAKWPKVTVSRMALMSPLALKSRTQMTAAAAMTTVTGVK